MSSTADIAHEFWDVNGIRLHVATAGAGPPLVLLHGFPEFWYSWRYLIPLLADRFRVLAPDLRGFGQSQDPGRGYDLDTLAADVAGLIDRAGGRAALVGHDWGGVIGWHAATLYPDRVAAYAAVAGPHPARYLELLRTDRRQLWMSLYTFFFQLPVLPEWVLSRARGAVLAAVMKRSAGRPGVFADAELEPYRELWSKPEALRPGLNYYRQMARAQFKLWKFYQENRASCPLCVVWGDGDPFLSLTQTRGLERWCRQPPAVHVLEDCGHWIAQEAPVRLAQILREFLKP